jgi:hypothetical protein
MLNGPSDANDAQHGATITPLSLSEACLLTIADKATELNDVIRLVSQQV